MLIKFTNTCTVGCEHCMEMSIPNSGEDIAFGTFKAAVEFGVSLGIHVFVFSGGEPTEHPKFDQFCQWFENQFRGSGRLFTVCSNGMWLKDPDKTKRVCKVLSMVTCAGMQVYTNKQWYREYDFVVRNKETYERLNSKVYVTIDSPIQMQDLGRARLSNRAQKEVLENTHYMSCLNSTLMAKQLPMEQFGLNADLRGKYCTPSVDANGFVHMSESRTCPFVGNVLKDSHERLYERMQRSKPCGGCAGYHRFIESTDSLLVKAKIVLGI